MGHIYKQKGSKRWWIKYYRDGKPFFESSKSTKKTAAEKLLKKREGEIVDGKLPGIYFDKVKFDELAEDYLTDYKLNGNKTLKKAERIIRIHLKPFFGDIRASGITTAKIKRYINMRSEDGAANATINRELAALKRMLNLGARSTPPKVNRVPYIPMLAEDNTRKGFFEHDEFIALRTALSEHLRGFCTFAYITGWRFSEIASLTWNRIDLKEGVVRLEAGETKNKEGRTIYLDDYVFHNHGKRITDIRWYWNKACNEAGLEGRLFHDLRRTAIRDMVRAGIPERVAMMISGHKTRSVFDRYNIVSPEDLKRAAIKRAVYNQTITKI